MAEAQPEDRAGVRPIALDKDDLQRAIDAWHRNPTSGHMGDVLSFAVSTENVDAVRDVLQVALNQGAGLSSTQKRFAENLLGAKSQYEAVSGVLNSARYLAERTRQVKLLFSADPGNPLVLLDMAQLRLAQGNVKGSERLLRSAKQFSPNDRLVLRITSRFLTHINRADEAHHLLASHARTASDPWLMASEIALSQVVGKSSKFIKIGQRILKEKSRSIKSTTELAAALAGVELASGNYKRAREYYRGSLLAPNDNVMAQVVTDQKILSLDASSSVLHSGGVNPYEAKALISWRNVDYVGALEAGVLWHTEEPYSSRPLQFLTSFLSASANYEDAIMLARRGLVADPDDIGLEVNLAYALAATNDLVEAERLAKKAKSSDPLKFAAQATATLGLIAMKRGDFVRADECYMSALDTFSRSNDKALYSICQAYYARTAFDCGHENVSDIIDAAVEGYKNSPVPDSAFILKGLGADISRRAESEAGVKRAMQWEFDVKKAELIKRNVLVDVGAPIIVNKR
ncbi:hypothetical protein ABE583_11055 [Stenotrophomonas sp. TWI143]|uniref:hypothetical protein n=1 Tax=Stenotrophomonas sp. TWI143 TaxID=3136771 RepID=UPI003208BEE1